MGVAYLLLLLHLLKSARSSRMHIRYVSNDIPAFSGGGGGSGSAELEGHGPCHNVHGRWTVARPSPARLQLCQGPTNTF